MRDRILVDTNVLVYAYDRSEAPKQQRAVEVLDLLIASGKGVISTQVLSEFFNAVTRKIRMPLTIEDAMASVENHTRAWRVLDVTTFIILEAIRGVRDHQLAFWDAQIWATARLNQVPVVLSEDFASGRTLDGVLFVNPFADGFEPAAWAT
ncbi:MAG: PIN domain-containing protein [Bacillota bacterium]|nr:PIN domain-containing protein [Bacillota bacterium]